ncbi:MAG TPA: retropepsin-like aspartic protease, partial [Steroidobacteraceae bacterium]|nr:retropepsin-like aspartic protease [Steroidobacteraceae bacterium]
VLLLAVVAGALLPRHRADSEGVMPPGPPVRPLAVGAWAAPQVVVRAPEPRFVAPTRRDRIGRIWAPVMINGRGPFRLVLDTGASDYAITAQVAAALGLTPDLSHPVLVRGVTGSAIVPTVRVDSLTVGDFEVRSVALPIVPDALGGAQGVLGTAGFVHKRIDIDFLHDRVTIARSHRQGAPIGYVTIPLERSGPGLLMVRGSVDQVAVHVVIDTGAQRSIGNEALRVALVSRHAQGTPDQIFDVTTAVKGGEMFVSPPIVLGGIEIRGARITYGEVRIFQHWQLTREPALLIGMDALGLLDALVIDYRLRELQLRPH